MPLNQWGGGGEYLEFGSGGSTFLALLDSSMNVTSIESDKNWIAHLKSWDLISHSLDSARLMFNHIDIGRVGYWGVPLEMDKKDSFPHYSLDIFKQKSDFSMVFIDGRFRVACILATIMYCGQDTRIFVHDFNNRAKYHSVLAFLDFIDTCDTLAEFKIKSEFDRQDLLKMYENYKYDYE